MKFRHSRSTKTDSKMFDISLVWSSVCTRQDMGSVGVFLQMDASFSLKPLIKPLGSVH